ncbi:sulfurtransferase TusA family protein [Synechococcus sp. CS-1332]|uniref:sulfurtransferase TusA family protein n=1 Tax=Synechococcus sp. CS-1332 TaxID=2847972 RepID=UPI00223BF123|nr:sulfurtransferase TusA family protein [Synechococcus sp. CS-1332]MCT0208974.1 sulfurtransferase TusA family protein [Synechococcus sp. CS-1332]
MNDPLALDLRGTACPVNFIRARLALETLPPGGWLQIDLDGGEPEQMVAEGLRSEGHGVQLVPACGEGVRLLVQRDGG